uniref:Uncharacterized protein n=1 Tax=Chromera velia CCMP2878 TaxID=1169474 RepID=A0A0G4IFB5_9ALVE|eukprot:Cvel_2468.t1-p1 / transcript=Cvel_2468.t1 / gene=Cvel_2468 / organism=Chromera_velia_CCMP2878 / gene_product=hypothetical protein / transcript_product=hypothetical protein / location=Cvel_scaffold97:55489-57000(-) / protein_length=504 / sequence_SO=supercontig / SO=protein_coding / is_pseudo=false
MKAASLEGQKQMTRLSSFFFVTILPSAEGAFQRCERFVTEQMLLLDDALKLERKRRAAGESDPENSTPAPADLRFLPLVFSFGVRLGLFCGASMNQGRGREDREKRFIASVCKKTAEHCAIVREVLGVPYPPLPSCNSNPDLPASRPAVAPPAEVRRVAGGMMERDPTTSSSLQLPSAQESVQEAGRGAEKKENVASLPGPPGAASSSAVPEAPLPQAASAAVESCQGMSAEGVPSSFSDVSITSSLIAVVNKRPETASAKAAASSTEKAEVPPSAGVEPQICVPAATVTAPTDPPFVDVECGGGALEEGKAGREVTGHGASQDREAGGDTVSRMSLSALGGPPALLRRRGTLSVGVGGVFERPHESTLTEEKETKSDPLFCWGDEDESVRQWTESDAETADGGLREQLITFHQDVSSHCTEIGSVDSLCVWLQLKASDTERQCFQRMAAVRRAFFDAPAIKGVLSEEGILLTDVKAGVELLLHLHPSQLLQVRESVHDFSVYF